MSAPQHYSFAAGAALDAEDRVAVLGGKGAALVRMSDLGLPVPPGFTLTTTACNRVRVDGWFAELDQSLAAGLEDLERAADRRFGRGATPLLVSVRSGAAVSMPGMMDTVLNVGMTDEVAIALGVATDDERFGWDTARRFVQSYASIVLGVPDELLGSITTACLGSSEGHDLAVGELAEATRRMRAALSEEGFVVPDDPGRQLGEAVAAVFSSWDSDRARTYREVEGLSDALGTAATVQMMTFGNRGARSGTGVAFSRDPSTGAAELVGDFLVGAQGEDVVAGTHTTLPVRDLRSTWPDVGRQLDDAAVLLERDVADLVDIEFTVEDGTLWLLQVRQGKRSPRAALRIAIDLAEDPDFPVERTEALERVAEILRDPPTRSNPDAQPVAGHHLLAEGLPASPGRVTGSLHTDLDAAISAEARGEHVILVRRETSPADIAGMAAARGLVTTLGGLVSHAAVVARSWGLPAVVGVAGLELTAGGVTVGEQSYPDGEIVTIDGDRGEVLLGDHPSEEVEVEEVAVLRRWQREAALAAPPPPDGGPAHHAEPATVTSCERVLALKGAADAVSVAGVLGCPVDDVSSVMDDLLATGAAQALPGGRLSLLPPARARVDELFAADASRMTPVIEPLLGDFHAANDRLKEILIDWQTREVDGEAVPNDHADAVHDAAVVARLRAEVHADIMPVISRVAGTEPRLARYEDRLVAALGAVEDGDLEMVANPLRDSYHTVWFELHEELIRLAGRNRADEAAAGRG